MEADEKKLLADFAFRLDGEYRHLRRHTETLGIAIIALSVSALGISIPIIIVRVESDFTKLLSIGAVFYVISFIIQIIGFQLLLREVASAVEAKLAMTYLNSVLDTKFLDDIYVDPLSRNKNKIEGAEGWMTRYFIDLVRLGMARFLDALASIYYKVATVFFSLSILYYPTVYLFSNLGYR